MVLEKILMYAPLVKSASGKFMAVLSDDSIDREKEIIGKQFLFKVNDSLDRIPALANHKNDVFMQVGEWTNKRIEVIKGHNALVAEPKFWKSNPNSQIIEGMLNEGAQIGISIGAIPKDFKMTKINGTEYKEYTDGELLEASFVAIPANKHAMAMAVAKSLNLEEHDHQIKSMEGFMMDEEVKEYLDSQFVKLHEKIDNLQKEVDELTEVEEETEEEEKPETEEADAEESEAEKKLQEELTALKNTNSELTKKLQDAETHYKQKAEKETKDNIDKSKLPILSK